MEGNGPSGREWGELTNEVKEIRHDVRTAKMNVDYLANNLRKTDLRVSSMNAKVYTTISVAVIFISLIGFALNVFLSLRN